MTKTMNFLRTLTDVLFWLSIVAAIVAAIGFDWKMSLIGFTFAAVWWFFRYQISLVK